MGIWVVIVNGNVTVDNVYKWVFHVLNILIKGIYFNNYIHIYWGNKGHGMCYHVWDGAYKRTLAVNRKE